MKKSSTGAIFAITIAAVGTLALVGFRSLAVEAVYPVERVRQTFATRVWTRVTGFFRGSSACAENVRLRREVASLSLLRTDLERLESENERLRRALEYRARKSEEWLAAGVLSSRGGAAGAHRTLRVDKGSLDGVNEGAVVVAPEGLVGRVTFVTLHTSEIALITDSSVKVACEIETERRPRPRGILSGGAEDVLYLRHLTDGMDLPAGSRVLTSGLGGVFPKGLEVGTLIGVRKDSDTLSSDATLQPAVDFSTLEDVFVRREK